MLSLIGKQVEIETAESMKILVEFDSIKSRMQDASNVIQVCNYYIDTTVTFAISSPEKLRIFPKHCNIQLIFNNKYFC